ncbi:citrate transporter [Corynebacterium efficiens YS-314]|uniref:SLC13 family permease n=1 Tax=Corynebacterium efficiens TaxID=152794 RepID=UPI0001B86EC8|nr:SLC13 family permease [Corynebacterium efficiens]EEW48656.1 citrate transporter [Corynebacterium efficiens YS-314]
MGQRVNLIAMVATVVATIVLVSTDAAEAYTLFGRLVPIFAFVTGMSVVVNIAAQVGVFDAVTRALETVAPVRAGARRQALWSGLILISIVVTVFLSLDTTAILLTPLAIAVARRNGLNLMAVAFAVVWIANIASLHLPVSNLTNLLALSGGGFTSELDYITAAWVPATIATGIAVAAALVINRLPERITSTTAHHPRREQVVADPLLRPSLITLGLLLPALASPIPYWLSSSVAAVVMVVLAALKRRDLLRLHLIPWPSLLLATAMSTVATAVSVLGGAQLVQAMLDDATPLTIATTGAVAANLLNNIPAFLALEPAVSTTQGYLALLIGVNTGPIITPWASLATLLWHDQLLRAGVQIRWRTFILFGLILAPVAVVVPALSLML